MADLSFLQKFTKGNTGKIKRYISMYLEQAPDILERMSINIREKNWSELAINAHSLKPQAEFMGLTALKEVLLAIEEEIKNGELSNITFLFGQVLQLHQEGAAVLIKTLKNLKEE